MDKLNLFFNKSSQPTKIIIFYNIYFLKIEFRKYLKLLNTIFNSLFEFSKKIIFLIAFNVIKSCRPILV